MGEQGGRGRGVRLGRTSEHGGKRAVRRHGVGISIAVLLALLTNLAWAASVGATNVEDFTVSAPATGGGTLEPDTAGVAWTTLTGPTIDVAIYSNPDVFAPGLVFTLTLPLGFEWNAAVIGAPSVAIAPAMPAGFCTLTASPLTYTTAASGAGRASFTVSGTHDVGCRITVAGLQVRPVAGVRPGTGGTLQVGWVVPGAGTGRADAGWIGLLGTSPSATAAAPTATRVLPTTGPRTLPPTDVSPVAHEAMPSSGAGWVGVAILAVVGVLAAMVVRRRRTAPNDALTDDRRLRG